ncbi:hypothetical protein [Poritiphilus flavus]|uniref:Lipoprotein n=1 Tax=Poritiphilus flavus TaxID=2697053 RepID=A0A6L9EI13_9FLAO|nr:hypothetical protein [Poritiphilus flavus]NAS14323.1 hypothetical protein [Poritiphilus flavus]
MRKSIGLVIFILLLSCKSAGSHTDLSSARVKYLTSQGRNSLTVQSTDLGNNQDQAIFNAKKLAFQNLFFRGISGSPFNDPLIGINERQGYKANETYFKEFYSGRMESFILSSSENLEKVKGGQKLAKVTLQINLRALRKDLEDKSVIKKFGL